MRLTAQSPGPAESNLYSGPCPAESLVHQILERYRQHFLFSMRFLDHGLSSGTFCKRMLSVKMVCFHSSTPITAALLRADQEASGTALVAVGEGQSLLS